MPRKLKQVSPGKGHSPYAPKARHGLPSSGDPIEGGKGQTPNAQKGQVLLALPPSQVSSEDGRSKRAKKARQCLPSSDDGGKGLARRAKKGQLMSALPPSLEETIAQILYWHRQRCFAMETRKRLDLALGAFLRTQLGWSLAIPEKERKRIAGEAQAILDDPAGSEFEQIVGASHLARQPFADIEKQAVDRMEDLSVTLPAWTAFGHDVRGFGLVSLAVIVGEAGDLANYPTVSKLWKRMGLAVMDGVRQGGLAKGASKDDWISHGYSPKRRSHMWNIGDALIKAQVRKVKDDDGEDTGERTAIGLYGEIYLVRKAYEFERDPDMQPIKAHRRAQRYMEKRLLKHLWQTWRRARMPVETVSRVPAATLSGASRALGHTPCASLSSVAERTY